MTNCPFMDRVYPIIKRSFDSDKSSLILHGISLFGRISKLGWKLISLFVQMSYFYQPKQLPDSPQTKTSNWEAHWAKICATRHKLTFSSLGQNLLKFLFFSVVDVGTAAYFLLLYSKILTVYFNTSLKIS